jgi:hypothetical protein
MNFDDQEPLDLSPLRADEPPGRWQEVVGRTLERIDQALATPAASPFEIIAGWRRPLIAAALAAGLVLVLVERELERREVRLLQVDRLVAVSAAWPSDTDAPRGAAFLRALGMPGTGTR